MYNICNIMILSARNERNSFHAQVLPSRRLASPVCENLVSSSVRDLRRCLLTVGVVCRHVVLSSTVVGCWFQFVLIFYLGLDFVSETVPEV